MGLSSRTPLFDTETRPLKQQGADPITGSVRPLGLLLAYNEKKQMPAFICQVGYNEVAYMILFSMMVMQGNRVANETNVGAPHN